MEDNLWWKTPFGGRWTSVEEKLLWQTTFGGRQPLVEESFGGRQPLVLTPSLDSHSKTESKLELQSAASTGNRICHRRKMYVALCMHMVAEKKTFLGKDNKTIII